MDNVKKFKEIANSLGELYEQKNKCYNNSFGDTYKKLGIISAVTRISDKFNRLCNLATNPDIDNLGESIEDTLKDLASYAIMTLMEYCESKAKSLGFGQHTRAEVMNNFIAQPDELKDDWEELDEAKTLNVGDKMLCTKTVVMDDDSIAYYAGRTYNVEQANCITNEQGSTNHIWRYDIGNPDNWHNYFRKVK